MSIFQCHSAQDRVSSDRQATFLSFSTNCIRCQTASESIDRIWEFSDGFFCCQVEIIKGLIPIRSIYSMVYLPTYLPKKTQFMYRKINTNIPWIRHVFFRNHWSLNKNVTLLHHWSKLPFAAIFSSKTMSTSQAEVRS